MLSKIKKAEILKDLKDKIAKQKSVVFVDFTGLKVKDFSKLRKKLKSAGDDLKVAKKTLTALALEKSGLKTDIKKLKGEMALVFSLQDEISAAKTVWQFSKDNPALKILGGILEQKFVESERIIQLAQLPTKEELLAKLVGSVFSPVSNFVYALKANLKGLVYLLSNIKK